MKFPNGALRLALAFALGVGTTVAAAYTTFETKMDHATDRDRIERKMDDMADDIKILLQRTPPGAQARPIPPWREGARKEATDIADTR